MKKINLKTMYFVVSLFTIFSCKQHQQSDVEKLISKNPTTIKVAGSVDEIDSMNANVKVFTKSNRNTKNFEMTGKYRMAIKEIDGRICTRIDQKDLKKGTTPRSIISNEKEFIN